MSPITYAREDELGAEEFRRVLAESWLTSTATDGQGQSLMCPSRLRRCDYGVRPV